MRFSAGELARFVVPRTSDGAQILGEIVEVKFVGPLKPGDTFYVDGVAFQSRYACDYMISPRGEFGGGAAMDWQLQKIDPKDEPVALTRHEEEEMTS